LVVSIVGSGSGGDSVTIGAADRGVDFLAAFLAAFFDGGRGIRAAAATACSTAACRLGGGGGGGGVELGVAKDDDDDDDAAVVWVW
jgi:hypothetical protein